MLAKKIKRCQSQFAKCDSSSVANNVFYRLFESKLNDFIPLDFVDVFWSHLPADFEKNSTTAYKPLLQAIDFLSKSYKEVHNQLNDSCNEELRKRIFTTLKNHILSHKPHYLADYLHATYFRAFRVWLHLRITHHPPPAVVMPVGYGIEDNYDDLDDETESPTSSHRQNLCPGCSVPREACDCRDIYDKFCIMNKQLSELGLLEGLVGSTVMDIARIYIKRKVSSTGKALNFSHSYLEESTEWVQEIVMPWIMKIYNLLDHREDDEEVENKLDQYLRDAYANVRVSQMFDIIIEYPNSEAAIQDMKLCLDGSTPSTFWKNLIESVKQSLTEHLLHPGVATYDILTAYISAIKALRALDPSGLILQLVTEPVRRYLKSRGDTVRCIVTALTDGDHNSELNKEMIDSDTQTNENGMLNGEGSSKLVIPSDGEVFTDKTFENWRVDPIELKPTDDGMKAGRYSDIVSILVNIYETKDLFVEEYQKLLSQRLLSKYDECNIEMEQRNLELLTLRFSDCELHRCEVMLKDVITSKRLNKRILSDEIRGHALEDFRKLNVLIVSSPFWPDKFGPMDTVTDEAPSLEFSPEVENALFNYRKAFEAIQASRTLHWRHHLGMVNMDIKINGKTQNFTVSPLHASLIHLFKEKKSWRLDEIIHKTSLPGATIRSRLLLWKNNGLIRELGEDKYELVED